MPTDIKCPHCARPFDVEDVLSADVEQRLRQQYEQELARQQGRLEGERRKLQEEQQLFAEKRQRENELFQQKLQGEKAKLESEISRRLQQSIQGDFEHRLRLMKEEGEAREAKLRAAQQKEAEFLRRESELKNRESELEIQLQRRLIEERRVIEQQVQKEVSERNGLRDMEHQLKLRELEKQLEDQRRLAEEMKRRAEQGSTQLQGEVQELLLESMLREQFPFDLVQEVGKGVEGADCILEVRNRLGHSCGKIIFESKRTKAFNGGWIDKLKTDMRHQGADLAILVSQAYPKDMHCFGERDGVWVCSFSEVIALTTALRHTILRIADTRKAEENKGEKMGMLYAYLTGTEFRQQIETIVEGFLTLKNGLNKERIQMEKLWKEREKSIEKVLLATSGMYGSVKGIAGASLGTIALLEGGEDEPESALTAGG